LLRFLDIIWSINVAEFGVHLVGFKISCMQSTAILTLRYKLDSMTHLGTKYVFSFFEPFHSILALKLAIQYVLLYNHGVVARSSLVVYEPSTP
jgi:hypothetical protein